MSALTHRGVEHRYFDEGPLTETPVVSFLHGLLVSSRIWRPMMDTLASSHRVLALDWPGHGMSAPTSEAAAIDDLVDTVIALLDLSGVRRTALVGLSLGGIVAMAAASRYPDRVEALVLISTPHSPETESQRTRHRGTLDAASRIGQSPILKGIAVRMFGATTRRLRPDLVTEWLEEASRLDLGSIRRLSEAALARSRAPSFGAGAPRALIVRGEEDALLAPGEAGALSRDLGNAPVITIPRAGHLVPAEAPEAFSAELIGFLSRRSRMPGSL